MSSFLGSVMDSKTINLPLLTLQRDQVSLAGKKEDAQSRYSLRQISLRSLGTHQSACSSIDTWLREIKDSPFCTLGTAKGFS